MRQWKITFITTQLNLVIDPRPVKVLIELQVELNYTLNKNGDRVRQSFGFHNPGVENKTRKLQSTKPLAHVRVLHWIYLVNNIVIITDKPRVNNEIYLTVVDMVFQKPEERGYRPIICSLNIIQVLF